jgi:hypothetical protein
VSKKSTLSGDVTLCNPVVRYTSKNVLTALGNFPPSFRWFLPSLALRPLKREHSVPPKLEWNSTGLHGATHPRGRHSSQSPLWQPRIHPKYSCWVSMVSTRCHWKGSTHVSYSTGHGFISRPTTGYPGWFLSRFPWVSAGKCRDNASGCTTTFFFHTLSFSLFNYHLIIQGHIVWIIESVVK